MKKSILAAVFLASVSASVQAAEISKGNADMFFQCSHAGETAGGYYVLLYRGQTGLHDRVIREMRANFKNNPEMYDFVDEKTAQIEHMRTPSSYRIMKMNALGIIQDTLQDCIHYMTGK